MWIKKILSVNIIYFGIHRQSVSPVYRIFNTCALAVPGHAPQQTGSLPPGPAVTAVRCAVRSAVQRSAVQCSAVQRSAVQRSAVQRSAVQCSAAQCAVRCSAVRCSAVQCAVRSAQCGVASSCRISSTSAFRVFMAACRPAAYALPCAFLTSGV